MVNGGGQVNQEKVHFIKNEDKEGFVEGSVVDTREECNEAETGGIVFGEVVGREGGI